MKYINRYAIVTILVIITFYFLINSFNSKNSDDNVIDKNLVENIQELKDKVDYLEHLLINKENEIDNLKESFESNIRLYNQLMENSRRTPNDTIELKRFNNNRHSDLLLINDDRSLFRFNNDIELPNSLDFMPHLNGFVSYMQPKFKQAKNRFTNLVIGIPTIKRDKTSYLLETIKSLFDSMNEKERQNVLVVVLIAELTDNDFVQKTIANINLAFKKELDEGFMDIIVPPNEFYPDLEKIAGQSVGKNTFNDPFERIKWRTKQNYDFSFLMSYSLKRGMYYLQLEDDVVAKYGCISAIFDFINRQKTNKWLILEFTQLGFIGKLFKTRDLPVFINFFIMFATDKPVDWLADSVFSVKTCDPERGHAHCERSQIGLRARYKPSLFQHVGVQSSLKGKTQKLKDRDFGKHMIIIRSHKNPPAVLSTSLKTYMKYTIESAYLGQNYFWSFSPIANDYILFEFNEPIPLKKFYIKSGSPEHPDDKIFNATIQIQPFKNPKSLPKQYSKTTDNFYIVGTFSNDLGVASGYINDKFGKIKRFRIHILTPSENWILISEIDLTDTAMIVETSRNRL